MSSYRCSTIKEKGEDKMVTIRVSKEDIENGAKSKSALCPVALALNREGFNKVSVHSSYMSHEDKANLWDKIYLLDFKSKYVRRTKDFPVKVTTFIARFDAGLIVEPFEFKI